MNREIKFRQFFEGKFYYWGYVNGHFQSPLANVPIREAKNQQFTGLKDKNGKEIYEGDIMDCIYLFDGCKEHKLEVIWDNENARFKLKDIGECHQLNVSKSMWDMTRSKVIGNIYKNPELLN